MTAKLYELFRWHSSDQRPTRAAIGSLSEMREEMAASVKGHEVSGLFPAKGFGNDKNRVTLSSKFSSHGSWGIQYWITLAEPETFNLSYVTPDHYLALFKGVSKEAAIAILSEVEKEELPRWRVFGSISMAYDIANLWLAVNG